MKHTIKEEKMKRTVLIGLAVLIALAMLAGCAAPEASAPEGTTTAETQESASQGEAAETSFASTLEGKGVKEDGTPYKVGLMYTDLESEYIIWQEEYCKYLLEAAGCEVNVVNTHGNTAEESDAIDDFIEAGYDFVITTSVSSDDIANFQKLTDAGIEYICVSHGINGGSPALVAMTSDPIATGEACMQYLVDQIPDGEQISVISCQGYMGSEDAANREIGFQNIVEQNQDKISSYKEYPCDWTSTKAEAAVVDELTVNPELGGIVYHSDAMNAGVKSGLAQSGKLAKTGEEGHILWCGIDGGPAALASIRDGYMDCVIQMNPLKNATACVKAILEYLIPGKELPVDEVVIATDTITAENVDSGDWWGDYDIENVNQGIEWASTADYWNNECPF